MDHMTPKMTKHLQVGGPGTGVHLEETRVEENEKTEGTLKSSIVVTYTHEDKDVAFPIVPDRAGTILYLKKSLSYKRAVAAAHRAEAEFENTFPDQTGMVRRVWENELRAEELEVTLPFLETAIRLLEEGDRPTELEKAVQDAVDPATNPAGL